MSNWPNFKHCSCCVQWLLYNMRVITELSPRSAVTFCVDLLLGLSLFYVLAFYEIPDVESTMQKFDSFAEWLQSLIVWIMGNPAGLKLNKPLNAAIGNFFLYHLYLWRTYVTLLQPLMYYASITLRISCFLGVTATLALFSDLVSIFTLHIHCFFVYAARLYQLQMSAIISLWRLFRGKKYNDLRKRVDSMEYDTQQLFLGTLLFTALLFLLPTVLVYYVVFFGLRSAVLTVLFCLRIPHLLFNCFIQTDNCDDFASIAANKIGTAALNFMYGYM